MAFALGPAFPNSFPRIKLNGSNKKGFICRFCGEVARGRELPYVTVFSFWLQFKSLKKVPKLQIF